MTPPGRSIVLKSWEQQYLSTDVDTTRIVTNALGTTDIWRATDLEFLGFWERATALGDLYRTWQAMRERRSALPATRDFDLPIFDVNAPSAAESTPYCLPDLFYADMPPEAPMEVRLTVPGTAVRGEPLENLFSPVLRDALISDLMLCQGSREPMYQQIYQNVSAFKRCYVRLLLPTVNERDVVQRVYGVCRPLYAEQELMHWSTE
jgi:hypothetical protein